MAPLILHNVPDEELYVGEDGVKRPYALVFPQYVLAFQPSKRPAPRPKLGEHQPFGKNFLTCECRRQEGLPSKARGRNVDANKGSFGKSPRRSRSKAGTPARGVRDDDPSAAAADKLWGDWKQAQVAVDPAAGGNSSAAPGQARRMGSQSLVRDDSSSSAPPQPRRENLPAEVILRGYKNINHQYAAISHYETVAGRICEDYPREPPAEMRWYKSELRDSALMRKWHLTQQEREKVYQARGGEHWVKITFESAQAAERAVYASPQLILGHFVYAEPYHGEPPLRDEAIPEVPRGADEWELAVGHGRTASGGSFGVKNIKMKNGAPDWASITVPEGAEAFSDDTGTVTSATATVPPGAVPGTFTTSSSTTTNIGAEVRKHTRTSSAATTSATVTSQNQKRVDAYSRRIPTIQRTHLLPAEQALMPQQSYAQRLLNHIPFVKWFTGNMIGNQVPRTETGEFDWNRASLYWKFVWWLDSALGIFGGDIVCADKDD